MSVVKGESDFEITPEYTIKVLRCLGDGDNGIVDETFGLEVEIDLWNVKTDFLNGINTYSFGYEEWSQEVWQKIADYISDRIMELKNEEDMWAFCDWLESFECIYTRDENHLKDLPYIKNLIKDM